MQLLDCSYQIDYANSMTFVPSLMKSSAQRVDLESLTCAVNPRWGVSKVLNSSIGSFPSRPDTPNIALGILIALHEPLFPLCLFLSQWLSACFLDFLSKE